MSREKERHNLIHKFHFGQFLVLRFPVLGNHQGQDVSVDDSGGFLVPNKFFRMGFDRLARMVDS
jgi:hypothetical protein